MDGRYFDTTRNGNHSSFLAPTVVGRRRPLPSEICAESDPPALKNADFVRLFVCLFVDPTHSTMQQYNKRTVVNWSEYEKARR